MIKFLVTTFWFRRNIKHHDHATFMNKKVVTKRFIIELTVDIVVCKKVHKIRSVWCKIAPGEVGVSLPLWYHAIDPPPPGYRGLF